MTEMLGKEKIKQIELEAVVIRADGTREDLGLVAYHHSNPVLNAWGNLKIKNKRK